MKKFKMKRLRSAEDLEKYREFLQKQRDPNKVCVTVCNSTGCSALGGVGVKEAFVSAIKREGLDVEVIRTGCWGFCERGPVCVILPKKIFYQEVEAEDVAEIVEKTIKSGEIVERLLYTDPKGERIAHQPEIPFFAKQKREVLALNGKIDPESIDHYIEMGGYSSLNKALKMEQEGVIAEVKKSGIRGRGGAGFPTGIKWEICRNQNSDTKFIICNADEGDPGAFMDRALLEANPHSVLEGMIIAGYAIGAAKGYIHIRTDYLLATRYIKKAVSDAEALGLLGKNILGSSFSLSIEVRETPGAFVCGEETSLISSIEGERGMPRPKPPYPAQSGLFGKPTVINNVETLANIPIIINKGGNSYAKTGTESSKGTKVFAVSGKVNTPGLIEVPFGTTLRELIDIAGGLKQRLKAIQLGGPSGGYIKNLEFILDYEEIEKAGAMIGSGELTVMDETRCMVDVAKAFVNFSMEESCGKCTPCRVGIKRLSELLEKITDGRGEEEDLERLIGLSELIKESALCGLGKGATNPLRSAITQFRNEYELHIKEKFCPAYVCSALYTAPCADTCPVKIDVHQYVALISQEKFEEALELIREKNPFPSICGRVCHHPCEAVCRRGEIDQPVAIKALKRFVADKEIALRRRRPRVLPKIKRPERVAIIGAGPSGLTAAHYLGREGYSVKIFEAKKRPGGMLAWGIPDYRLPKRVLEIEISEIKALGVQIETGVYVDRELFLKIREDFDAVLIAIGAVRSLKLGIPGEDVEGVMTALEFLADVNLRDLIVVPKRVAVIGGGNAAIDAARCAVRFGADVSILYRRGREEMPAIKEEIAEAEFEGVKLRLLVGPKRVLTSNGKVRGVECVRMALGPFDSSGRRRPVEIEGSEFQVECDMIISAIGQKPDLSFLDGEIEIENGRIVTDKDCTTSISNIFAAGDCVTGPATVIEAIAAGERAASAIKRHLLGEEREIEPPSDVEREQMPRLDRRRRMRGFEEVELGFTKEMAISEANRCLRCHEKA
jgi:NADH-quinone oxidoreductase subunit F